MTKTTRIQFSCPVPVTPALDKVILRKWRREQKVIPLQAVYLEDTIIEVAILIENIGKRSTDELALALYADLCAYASIPLEPVMMSQEDMYDIAKVMFTYLAQSQFLIESNPMFEEACLDSDSEKASREFALRVSKAIQLVNQYIMPECSPIADNYIERCNKVLQDFRNKNGRALDEM